MRRRSWLGVFYPPMVLLMLLIVTVFVASLCFSVILSRQRQQIERLIEETAILAAELREERAARERRPRTRRVDARGGAQGRMSAVPSGESPTRSTRMSAARAERWLSRWA